MKNEPLPVKSPYLAHKMTDVMAETGLGIGGLTKKTGLSYGYMRRIVNGTVIPNRDALKRICDGLELDFAEMWKATHPIGQVAHEAEMPLTLAEAGNDLSGSGEVEAEHSVMRRKINQTMDEMSFEEMLDLLIHARSIVDGSGSSQDRYRNVDADGRHFRWEDLRTSWRGPYLHYSVLGVEGDWRYSQEQMEQLIKEGRVVIPPGRKIPRLKLYLEESV
jgi:hypothetical protein